MEESRILIVEDESIAAEDISRFLNDLGYSVTSIVRTGSETLKSVEKEKPDQVLMDIVLRHDQDGIKTIRLIQNRFDIPIVFLTACSDEKITGKSKHIEPYGYLFKPIDSRELYTTIEIALYKHARENKFKERQDRLDSFLDPATDSLVLETDLSISRVLERAMVLG